jgi:cyclic beta-1,2-glucan synthetase
MIASPLVAAGALVAMVVLRPHAIPAALPLLILWAAAPAIAFALSRPVPSRREVLGLADRAFLRATARRKM